MQEEVENRTVNLAISTTKLTGRSLVNAFRAYLNHRRNVKARKASIQDTHIVGEQTIDQLLGQNQGATNIEIEKTEIAGFKRILNKGSEYLPIGQRLEIDNRQLIIDSVDYHTGKVTLQDDSFRAGTGFPIFRVESTDFVRSYLEDWLDSHPAYTIETVETIPAEENHLPFDVVIQTLKTPSKAVEPELPPKPVAPAVNYHITDYNLGVGGAKQKFARNYAAICLLHELERSGAQADPDQQEVLGQYVGWGGLADAFDDTKPEWAFEYAQLKAEHTDEEYRAARASTLNAHYTSPTIIRAMYQAIENMGFQTGKRTIYEKRTTYRDQIRQDIDTIMKKSPTDFDAFLRKLEEMGYEVKRGKYASVKGKDQQRFVRFHSLGEGYSEEDIQAVIAGEKKHRARIKSPLAKEERAFNLLLVIDDKIRAKGPGYQQWATNYNLKQMAKTRIFLKEHNINSMDELREKANSTSADFDRIDKELKSAEQRLVEIAALKKNIINYAKTREVYVQYRKAGYSKAFFEAHREEITLHKAAKDAFQKMGVSKLPKVKELSEEYATVLEQKKSLYAQYRLSREEMREYQKALHNTEVFFDMDRIGERDNRTQSEVEQKNQPAQ